MHLIFDLLAALSAMAMTVLVWRWRLTGASRALSHGGGDDDAADGTEVEIEPLPEEKPSDWGDWPDEDDSRIVDGKWTGPRAPYQGTPTPGDTLSDMTVNGGMVPVKGYGDPAKSAGNGAGSTDIGGSGGPGNWNRDGGGGGGAAMAATEPAPARMVAAVVPTLGRQRESVFLL